MLPDPKIKCPATGFARTCRDILADCDCPKFVRITGLDPNTGQSVDRAGCVDAFLPMLLIENSQQQRQTAAAIESFRNEVIASNERALALQRASTVRENLERPLVSPRTISG